MVTYRERCILICTNLSPCPSGCMLTGSTAYSAKSTPIFVFHLLTLKCPHAVISYLKSFFNLFFYFLHTCFGVASLVLLVFFSAPTPLFVALSFFFFLVLQSSVFLWIPLVKNVLDRSPFSGFLFHWLYPSVTPINYRHVQRAILVCMCLCLRLVVLLFLRLPLPLCTSVSISPRSLCAAPPSPAFLYPSFSYCCSASLLSCIHCLLPMYTHV